MAQTVGYFQDRVRYRQGPFVICNAPRIGWRVECEVLDTGMPMLPHPSVREFIARKWNLKGDETREKVAEVCDALNEMSKEGKIYAVGRYWQLRAGVEI